MSDREALARAEQIIADHEAVARAEQILSRDVVIRARDGDSLTLTDVRALNALNEHQLVDDAHRAGRILYNQEN